MKTLTKEERDKIINEMLSQGEGKMPELQEKWDIVPADEIYELIRRILKSDEEGFGPEKQSGKER